jgi:hypothetical protein
MFKKAFQITTGICAALFSVSLVSSVLYLGSIYGIAKYETWQEARQRVLAMNAEQCITDRNNLLKATTDKWYVSIPKDITSGWPTSGHDGMGFDSTGPLWYFVDGTHIPLAQFISQTTKHMNAVCNIK